MPDKESKSQALQTSIERLFAESKRLREASDRLMREAEALKKLIPATRKKSASEK